jgi:4-amino-4-deoxy-L-arabinose transferase-like glycosyltransferase
VTDATTSAATYGARDLRTALLLGAATALAFALLGPWLHPAAGIYGEMDDYEGRAMRMANGEAAGDPYHPYGPSLLMLAAMQFGLGPLAAGRLVSAIAAGALVAASHRLLRAFVGPWAAGLGALAIATTEVTFANAMLASSDMPAAAFVALALLGWQRAAADARTARVAKATFAAGVAFGLALACRPSSLFVGAGGLPLFVFVPWRTALARLAATVLGTALGLAPHWLATRIWGAGPPHPGNAANLVLKYRLGFDYDRIGQMDAAAIQQDLREHWFEYLQRGLGDVWTLLTNDFARALTTSAPSLFTAALAVVLTIALLLGLVTRDRRQHTLALAGLAYAALLGLTFTPIDRMLLPLLPATVPLLLAAGARVGPRVATALGALVLATTLASLPRAAEDFAGMQVDQHFAAMRERVQRDGRPLVFLCDFGRTGDVPGALLLATFAGWRGLAADAQLAWLRDQVERHHADYVVYSRARSHELLATLRSATLPPGWTIERDDAVFVLRVPPPPVLGDWQTRVVRDGNEHVLSFQVPPLPNSGVVASAGFVVRSPDGATQLLPAAKRADGCYELRVPVAPTLVGAHGLTPVVIAEPGGVIRGTPLEHTFTN